MPTKKVVLAAMGDMLGFAEGAHRQLRRAQSEEDGAGVRPSPGAVRFNDAIAQGREQAVQAGDASVPTTSPCCSTPAAPPACSKGAVLLHRNLVANILQAEAWYQPALKKMPPASRSSTICALPIYHIFGFNTNMMLAMRMGGANLLIANPRDLPACSRSCRARRSTAFRPSTRCSTRLANHPDFGTVDWSGLGHLGRRRHGGAERHGQAVAARRPAARSSRATACRRPRPRPPATRSTAPPTAATSACRCPTPN